MEATPYDAALYVNNRMCKIWRDRNLGDVPKFLLSKNTDGTVNFSVRGTGRGMSPFFTVNHDLVAVGKWPEHDPVDLQDGDQFYQLIDRIISDVL